MRPLERRLAAAWREQVVSTTYDPTVVSLDQLLRTVEALGLQVGNISVSAQAADGTHRADFRMLKRKHRPAELAVHALVGVVGVRNCVVSNSVETRQ